MSHRLACVLGPDLPAAVNLDVRAPYPISQCSGGFSTSALRRRNGETQLSVCTGLGGPASTDVVPADPVAPISGSPSAAVPPNMLEYGRARAEFTRAAAPARPGA
jgi:hypothetical protein